MLVWMIVRMCRRTGGMLDLSTAGFAMVSATALFEDNPPPQVTNKLICFLGQRHRLFEVGQEISDPVLSHTSSFL